MVAEGVKVLEQIAALDGSFTFPLYRFPWGCQYYLDTGKMMEEDGLRQLASFDAILLGAVGYPGVPDHISLRDLLLKIRKGFDQYIKPAASSVIAGRALPLERCAKAGD